MAEQSYTSVGTALLSVLARAIDDAADLVELTDLQWRLVHVNRAFERATGYGRAEVIGRPLTEIFDGENVAEKLYEELTRNLSDAGAWAGRIRRTTRAGAPLVLDVVVTPVRDDDDQLCNYLAVARDITAAEHAKSELMQADRLATVGQLAAGVAHEINNPLAYILANITYLAEAWEASASAAQLEPDAHQEMSSALADIEHGALRIRDIVRDLGAFARPAEDTAGAIDVRTVLDASIRLLVHEIKHRARVVCEYQEAPPTWGDARRLGQVFLNLVLNAVQAIPIGSVEANEVRIETRTSSDGQIEVEVADTGEGIPEDVLPRIFDPFFTTRPVGQGSGLGLAMAHSIVSSLGGTLSVRSEVGEGTAFTVRLPPCPPEATPEAATAQVTGAGLRRRRVLVVDDEPGVLRAMQRMLPGHDLTCCAAGAEALALLRAGEYDLVVCDVMMPEMSGMDVFRAVEREAPAMARRFVFITGGAFTADAQEFLAAVDVPTIQKPFETGLLRDLVERLLAKG